MASIHNKWFYVKEPVYPETISSGAQFKARAIYSRLIEVVKANPGLTGREIAERLGRPERSVSTFLWTLRKYTGAIDFLQEGYHRTPGLNDFQQVPSIQKMISKAGSQKTWDPWVRRLFNYEKWLKENRHFDSVTALLDDYKNATTQDRRYYHIDLISDYVNSSKSDKDTKDTIVKAIRAYYAKNRAELPREKITYRREMLSNLPQTAEEYVKPDEIWRIINDGSVIVRDKAIIASMLCLGVDESTFAEHFNYFAYPQIIAQLGENPKEWDLSRAPVRINLVRSKTQVKYYNYLPAKALHHIRDWLAIRLQFMGKKIEIHKEFGFLRSDPVFVTNYRNPIDERNINGIVREGSFRSGVQQYVPGTKMYRIHAHEFRDTFRTTCKIAGVDTAVAEFFIGHNIDNLGYDKSPLVSPEFFKTQYQIVEPYICGEELKAQFAKKKQDEFENRLAGLEAQLRSLVASKGSQVLAQGQSHSEST